MASWRGFLRRYAWALILALNLGLALSYAGLWLLTVARGDFWRADFTAYYTGWTLIRTGRAAELYDLAVQREVQAQILGPYRFKDDLLPHNTLPHVAWLLAPLGALPLRTAYLVWTGFNLVVLGLLVRAWWQAWAARPRRARWLMVTAALAFPALLSNFMLGTFAVLMAAALWGAYRSARTSSAGLGLALAALSARPQTGLLPAWGMVAGRRWRAVLVGGAILAVWMGGATLALGPAVWGDYGHLLRADSAAYGHLGIYPETMYNLRGTLTLHLGYPQAALINAITWLAFGSAMLLVGWLWWRAPYPASPLWELQWSLTLGLTLFFSPHLNPQDGWLMVLMAVWLDEALDRAGRPRGVWTLFALLAPLACLVGEFAVGGSLGVRIPTLVLLVLTGWSALEWGRLRHLT